MFYFYYKILVKPNFLWYNIIATQVNINQLPRVYFYFGKNAFSISAFPGRNDEVVWRNGDAFFMRSSGCAFFNSGGKAMKKKLLLLLVAVLLLIPSSLFAQNDDKFWDVNESRKDLEISMHEVTLTAVGEQVQLEANLKGNGNGKDNTLLWIVRDESICTVDETGLITAVGEGSTDVMVYTEDKIHRNICHVTVAPVLKEISISPADFTLRNVGKSVQLNVIGTPNNIIIEDIEWSSSDSKVCTVDENGNVTSVGGGFAEITAIEKNSNLIAKSQIFVDIPLQGISLSEKYLILDKGDSVNLEVNLIPENTIYRDVQWSVSEFSSYENLVCSLYGNGVIVAEHSGFCIVDAYIDVGNRFRYSDRCYIFVRTDDSDPEEIFSWNCGASGNNVKAEFNTRSGVLRIYGNGAMYDYYGSNELTPWYDYKEKIQSVVIEPGVTTIGAYSFWECYGVQNISIPSTVYRIGPHAMNGCMMLKEIDIPESVTDIQEFVFCNCFNLESVDIPDKVTEIDTGLFENCEKITEINLSKNITSIIDEAFVNCRNLASINVDEDNRNYISMGGVLFTSDKKELVAYPGGKKDKNYTVPNGTSVIQDAAFSSCEYLENVTVPDSVTSLGVRVFAGSQNLRSIELSDNITAIKDSAFTGCKRLENVNIPERTVYIGDYVFLDCHSLKSLELPASLMGIGSTSGYSGFVFCENYGLEKITVDENNLCFSSDEFGVLYNKDKTELIFYPVSLDCSLYKMPASVQKISDSSFADNGYLLDIEVETDESKGINPDSIELLNNDGEIGNEAFAYSLNLKNVTISDQINTIGDRSFADCKNLKSVIIPDNVSSISSGAFSGSDDVTIYGKYGSCAELYAKQQGIPFKDASLVNPVTDISFNVSKIDLLVGKSFSISATVVPENTGNKKLTWKSDNTSVVSVKNGVITALKPGATVVTATSANGDVSASCVVYVHPETTAVFPDVPANSYYVDAVSWAVGLGITNGTSTTTFSPDRICTRAEVVTFLWRAAGSPEPKSSYNPFSDVPYGQYYTKAVLWAVENEITKGTGTTTFSPAATCDRAQIVTFLYRAKGSPAVAVRNAFSDVNTGSYYAKAVTWAVDHKITTGTGDNKFTPSKGCSRAEIVTFLYRAN